MQIKIQRVYPSRDGMNARQWTVELEGHTATRPNTVSYAFAHSAQDAIRMEGERQIKAAPMIASLKKSLAGYGVAC